MGTDNRKILHGQKRDVASRIVGQLWFWAFFFLVVLPEFVDGKGGGKGGGGGSKSGGSSSSSSGSSSSSSKYGGSTVIIYGSGSSRKCYDKNTYVEISPWVKWHADSFD
jgi:hypothetical protein